MLNDKGQTLVEFAFVILLLLVLLIGITEFSRAWNKTTVMTNGARAGARYAATRTLDANYVDDVRNYTMFQVMTGLKVGSSDVLVNMSAFSSTFPNATTVPLVSGTKPALKTGSPVTVIVRYTFHGLGGNIVPVIQGDKRLARRATMRYEGN